MYAKTICSITGGIALIALSATTSSAQGLYVSGKLGIANPNDSDVTDSYMPGYTLNVEMDSGFASGVALGYDFGNNMRLEGELAYQQNDVNSIGYAGYSIPASGDVTATTFGINGYYDFNNESPFTPFLTAGIGMAKVEVNDLAMDYYWPVSDDDTVFAYKFGAGIGYAINDRLTVDATYRYNGFADPEFETVTATYSSHNVYLGLRVSL